MAVGKDRHSYNYREMIMPRIEMQDVESSQIHSIGHEPETKTLAVRFKNWKGEVKGLYHYQNVTTEDFEAFKNAESKGKHFGLHIKATPSKYPFECIEKQPPADDQPIAA